MDLNVPPSAETEGTQETTSPSPTPVSSPPVVVERPSYGSWMLVTRKPRNNNNRFQALANNKERPSPNKTRAAKGKQPAQSGGNSKGKSSTPYNPPSNRRGGMPVDSPAAPSINRHYSANNGRDRGGQAAAFREKGGVNRRGGASTSGAMPATRNWFSNVKTRGVFQFGGVTQPHGERATNVQDQHGPRSLSPPTSFLLFRRSPPPLTSGGGACYLPLSTGHLSPPQQLLHFPSPPITARASQVKLRAAIVVAAALSV
nr:uncharacterized protein LOC109164759 [Ipomoea trifida]